MGTIWVGWREGSWMDPLSWFIEVDMAPQEVNGVAMCGAQATLGGSRWAGHQPHEGGQDTVRSFNTVPLTP